MILSSKLNLWNKIQYSTVQYSAINYRKFIKNSQQYLVKIPKYMYREQNMGEIQSKLYVPLKFQNIRQTTLVWYGMVWYGMVYI